MTELKGEGRQKTCSSSQSKEAAAKEKEEAKDKEGDIMGEKEPKKKNFRDLFDDQGNPLDESTVEALLDESLNTGASKAKERKGSYNEEFNIKLAELQQALKEKEEMLQVSLDKINRLELESLEKHMK